MHTATDSPDLNTKIMGILNVTPDSFSDGGQFESVDAAVHFATQLVAAGADMIDVGGESTRPGSQFISAETELDRVLPVIAGIRQEHPDIPLSIDTWKPVVAEAALKAGATAVNCLNGWQFDPRLLDVLVQFECQVIVYHASDTPDKMQQTVDPQADMVAQVLSFFTQTVSEAQTAGIEPARLMLDPGIGFGKTLAQNIDLITQVAHYRIDTIPVVIGVSRKGHVGEILKTQLELDEPPPAHERDAASLAAASLAVLGGAQWVRTHDVRAAKEFFAVFDQLRKVGHV